jgi:eukaryotic-like serine/threonine-protein kinase
LKLYHEAVRDLSELIAEAQTTCALEGPWTVRVFDMAPEQGWIAYEWAGFGSVRDHLRAHHTTFLAPVMTWLLPLARGLERVHAAGYVHNDIKPANVLFLGAGLPVIADFGITRKAGAPAPRGSMGYMSPERLAGRVSNPRDDIYGFGRLLEDVLAHVDAPLGHIAAACTGPDSERPSDGKTLVTRLRVEWMPP